MMVPNTNTKEIDDTKNITNMSNYEPDVSKHPKQYDTESPAKANLTKQMKKETNKDTKKEKMTNSTEYKKTKSFKDSKTKKEADVNAKKNNKTNNKEREKRNQKAAQNVNKHNKSMEFKGRQTGKESEQLKVTNRENTKKTVEGTPYDPAIVMGRLDELRITANNSYMHELNLNKNTNEMYNNCVQEEMKPIGNGQKTKEVNFNENTEDTGEIEHKTDDEIDHDKKGETESTTTNEANNRRAEILKTLIGKLQKTENKLKVKFLDKLKGELQRTSDVARIEGASWENMNLSESLIHLLENNDFSYPSPVQVHTIPKALAGDDLLIRAKNGTGKTLSYVIPAIELLTRLRKDSSSETKNFALVIVPTRELAMQVGRVFRRIGVYCRESIMSTFGGSNYHEDILRIERGAAVIVGTPGRLFDLIDKNVIRLERFRFLVLDEADKILAKEFIDDIELIVNKFNQNRFMPEICPDRKTKNGHLLTKQMLLVSATFPVEIFEFVRKNMNEAKEINLMPELHLKGLRLFYVRVDEEKKLHCLKTILCKLNYHKVIIFCNSVISTEKLGYRVLEMDFPCYYFHSKMSFEERRNVFHKFTTSSSEICVLVATDLITRGIDVPEVNVVINFNLPKSVDSFLHRIGRAGRFGTTGCVVNLCNDDEIEELTKLEKQTGMQVKAISDPTFKDFTNSND